MILQQHFLRVDLSLLLTDGLRSLAAEDFLFVEMGVKRIMHASSE
jgi:hypothetical protein